MHTTSIYLIDMYFSTYHFLPTVLGSDLDVLFRFEVLSTGKQPISLNWYYLASWQLVLVDFQSYAIFVVTERQPWQILKSRSTQHQYCLTSKILALSFDGEQLPIHNIPPVYSVMFFQHQALRPNSRPHHLTTAGMRWISKQCVVGFRVKRIYCFDVCWLMSERWLLHMFGWHAGPSAISGQMCVVIYKKLLLIFLYLNLDWAFLQSVVLEGVETSQLTFTKELSVRPRTSINACVHFFWLRSI